MAAKRKRLIVVFLTAFCLLLAAGIFLCAPRGSASATTYFGQKNVADLRKADPEEIAALRQYSGRDYGIVSTVKNQGSYSLCWAFAAIAASETSILREGVGGAVQSSYFDLEERTLAYRAHNPQPDPFHLTDDDIKAGDGSWDKGGYVEAAGKTMLLWNAPTKQYYTSDSVGVSADYPLAYQLESMITVDYSVENVKRLVAEYGAAAFSFPIHNYPGGGYNIDKYFNNINQSKHNPHACIIVGWDDDIPASKFTPDVSSTDGGWIVKNSWGSTSNDQGYFYLSYDSDIYDIWAFDFTEADTFDHQYLYNGVAERGSVSVYGEEATARAAAIYCAQGGTSETREELTAVNVGIGGEDVDVRIFVYTGLNPNYGNPSSPLNDPVRGEPVASASGNVTRDGYYTFYLDKSVPLENGESFSIVVEATGAEGTKKARILGTQDYMSTNDMTFEYKNGAWSNLRDYGKYCAHVRAYTRDVVRSEGVSPNDLQFASIRLDKTSFEYTGAEITPKATVTLGGKTLQEGRDYEVRYEDNKNALGNAAAIAEGCGEYSGEARAYFYIAQASVPPNKPVNSSQNAIVVGSEVTRLGEIPLPEGWIWCIDVDLTKYDYDVPMGWAIAFPVTDGNYKPNTVLDGTDTPCYQSGVYVKRESVRHEPVSLAGAEISVAGTYYYSGENIVPETIVKVDGNVLTRGVHYTVRSSAVGAGQAAATVEGMFTFTGNKSVSFTIEKAQEPPKLAAFGEIFLEEGMKTLADVPVPAGWRWVDGQTPVTLGTMRVLCEYVGADAENYAVRVREAELTFTEKPTEPDTGGGDPEPNPDPDPKPNPDPEPDPDPDVGGSDTDTGDTGGTDSGKTDGADDNSDGNSDGESADGDGHKLPAIAIAAGCAGAAAAGCAAVLGAVFWRRRRH